MHLSTLAKRGIVLLLFAVLAFYFYGLGHLPLVGPDEPRYAQVAREMFLRHDLVTPTLGGHTWFEKPALLYWLMIASFKIFGVSEWSARLPAAISGLLTIAAVYVLSSRIRLRAEHDTYALWSTLAVATMVGVVAFARAASFDILLTMTATWSLTFYLLYEVEDSKGWRRACLAGFYFFIGVSLLAKGLVGIVIPIGVVSLYHLFRRRLPERKLTLSLLWGMPLALLVGAVWYGPVIARHGWLFIDQFFIQHHFERYLSNKYHHSQPVFYYLLIVPLLALPWTAFFFDSLRGAPRWLRNTRTSPSGDNAERILTPFALAWLVFPLLFFSFANSKLPGYILPVLPATALLVGARLRDLENGFNHWATRATAVLFLVAALGAVGYGRFSGDLPLAAASAIAVPLLLAGVFGLISSRRQRIAPLAFAGATLVALVLVLSFLAAGVAERESSRELLQLAAARGYGNATVYGLQRSDRSPEFYAAGRTSYGPHGEAIMYEEPAAVIAESRKRGQPVLAFVPLDKVAQLTAEAGGQVEVIGNNGRYAIVAVKTY